MAFKSVTLKKTYYAPSKGKAGDVPVSNGTYLGRSDNKFNSDKPHFEFDCKDNGPVCINHTGHMEYIIKTKNIKEGDNAIRFIYNGKVDSTKSDNQVHQWELLRDEDQIVDRPAVASNVVVEEGGQTALSLSDLE